MRCTEIRCAYDADNKVGVCNDSSVLPVDWGHQQATGIFVLNSSIDKDKSWNKTLAVVLVDSRVASRVLSVETVTAGDEKAEACKVLELYVPLVKAKACASGKPANAENQAKDDANKSRRLMFFGCDG